MTFIDIVERRQLIQGTVAALACRSRGAWSAPTVRPLSLRQLVDASHAVAVVVPSRPRGQWTTALGKRRIVTLWQVDSVAVIGGRLTESCALATLGGTVDDVQQWVPHEARFVGGSPFLTFLRRGHLSGYWVCGMLQGAYALSTDRGVVLATPEQEEFLSESSSAAACLNGLSLEQASDLISIQWES